jgi:glycosyltransferase involved in cell wall biosynthesis
MGVAQGMDILLDLAQSMSSRMDLGFLFVGRGSEAKRLANKANALDLKNVLFRDEIDPDEIPDLYSQCHIGLVALDPRHKSHNIPGKFITYMQSGLPVLANVNQGNDLADMIRKENVGRVSEDNKVDTLLQLAQDLLGDLERDREMLSRCLKLFYRDFSSEHAVKQIVSALQQEGS